MEMPCDGSDRAAAPSYSSPSIVLGSLFSFPVLRNFSVKSDTFPQAQCTFLCFALGTLEQGLSKNSGTSQFQLASLGSRGSCGASSTCWFSIPGCSFSSPPSHFLSFLLLSFFSTTVLNLKTSFSAPSQHCSCPSANETMSRNTGPPKAA